MVLVEGRFTEEDALILLASGEEGEFTEENADLQEAWCITIPEDGNPVHTIRFMPPEKQRGLFIYIWENGEWVQNKVKWDGKYMVFKSEGNSVTFALVKGKPSYAPYWAVLGLLLLATLVFVIIRRRKARNVVVGVDV